VKRRYRLRLYVLGSSGAVRGGARNLRAALDACIQGRYELQIVDVERHPRLVEQDRIIATPTLLRLRPVPERRAIGSVEDPAQLRAALDLI
jgi:circadian clock protein KaiB